MSKPWAQIIIGAILGGIGFSIGWFLVRVGHFKPPFLSALYGFAIFGFFIGIIEGILHKSIFKTIFGGILSGIGGAVGIFVVFAITGFSPEWEFCFMAPFITFPIVGAFIGIGNGVISKFHVRSPLILLRSCVRKIIAGSLGALIGSIAQILIFLILAYIFKVKITNFIGNIVYPIPIGIFMGGFIVIVEYYPHKDVRYQ